MDRKSCPSCAASIEVAPDGSTTCPYCGTESGGGHVSVDVGEVPPPARPPTRPGEGVDPEAWRFEEWIGALIDAHPGDRAAIASRVPAFSESELVWAPILGDLMIGADAPTDLALGRALGRLADTWKSVALRRQVLRVVRSRLPKLGDTDGVVAALGSLGVAGLKELLALADAADARGDDARVEKILEPIWELIDRQSGAAAAACFETLCSLLPTAGPATRRTVIHYLADCADGSYQVALAGRRERHGFRFVVPLLARAIAEYAGRHDDVADELCTEIERLHTYHSKSTNDEIAWRHASRSLGGGGGRDRVEQLIDRLYPDANSFTIDAPPDEGANVTGEVTAQVDEGGARCPACAAPVPIRGVDEVVACRSCSRPVRLPAGVRRGLSGRALEDEIEHWSEADLIVALRKERDPERRRTLADEIDAARTHGAHYVEALPALIDHFIEEDDSSVAISLESAFERMVETGGEPFRDALLTALRARPDARRTRRLLRCLASCGEEAFDLLLEFAAKSYSDGAADGERVADATIAIDVAGEALASAGYPHGAIDRLCEMLLEMPATHEDLAAWQLGDAVAGLLSRTFQEPLTDETSETADRLGAVRARILRFLDDRIEPRTTYSGMAPRPGCALFYTLGGPPGLSRLAFGIETAWEGTESAAGVEERVAMLDAAGTDEVRLLALCAIRERPDDLGASASAAIAVLRGDAGEPTTADAPSWISRVLRRFGVG